MLILTRKKMETIRIGDDISVQVMQTGRRRVKLGIEAPAHLRVLRGELEIPKGTQARLSKPSMKPLAECSWEFVHEFGNI